MKKILLCMLMIVASFTLFVSSVKAASVKCVYSHTISYPYPLHSYKTLEFVFEINSKGNFSQTIPKNEDNEDITSRMNKNDFIDEDGSYYCPYMIYYDYDDNIVSMIKTHDDYAVYLDKNKSVVGDNNGVIQNADCEYLLGDPDDPEKQDLAYWLQWILNILKYAAIIALLVLSTFDFVKAIVQDDKDALRKALLTAGRRFIFAILIFFLPIIVEVLMKLLGAYGTCGIG